MKMAKSFLLGCAAGLVAITGAQAADLPVKAKPVRYVKICSMYGAGFYYIPGTDTCLKVGGYIRSEMNFNSGGSFSVKYGDHSARSYDFESTRLRFVASFDARSQTEYGTLRSYFNLGMQASNGGGGSNIPTYANRGFIQWAGITAGLADSFFDFYVSPRYGNSRNVLSSFVGGPGLSVFGYTARFGNGLSATVAAEDTTGRRTTIYGQSYAGRQWPDFVGNLRIDQAWGSAQVMAAVHQVRGATSGEQVGWAAGAGLTINLPWAKGDSFSTQFTYAKGAINYVGNGFATGSISVSENGSNFAYGNIYDGVTNASNGLELTTGWSIVAGVDHRWNRHWKTSLYGGYADISYNSTAATVLNGGGSGNPNWTFAQIGSRTVWTPVRNLDISVDLMYNHAGTATAQGGSDFLTASDVGWLQGMFRLQRNFWP